MAVRARLLLASAAVLAVGLPGAVLAQDNPVNAGVQVTFQGDVAGACRMNTPTTPSSTNVSVRDLAPGSADIAIDQLVDDDGQSIGAVIILVLPAVCNQAHTLSLNSLNGALLSDGPELAGGPFRSRLPYVVTVSWAGGQRAFQTADGALSFDLTEAAAGPVTVTIEIPSGGAPLAAGAYTDELVLQLGAAG